MEYSEERFSEFEVNLLIALVEFMELIQKYAEHRSISEDTYNYLAEKKLYFINILSHNMIKVDVQLSMRINKIIENDLEFNRQSTKKEIMHNEKTLIYAVN